MSFKLLGVGSPLVDLSLAVSGDFLSEYVPGGKGGTRNISTAIRDLILRDAAVGLPLRTPGGSAGNTVRVFSGLGGDACLFGKVGTDDDGDFFRKALRDSGTDDSLLLCTQEYNTGYCLSLVTEDAERTMLSDLGASLAVKEDDVKQIDFSRFDYLLLEGYLSDEPWINVLLQRAGGAGCRIALDLNNFELAARKRDLFFSIIDRGIDLIFANIQEFRALFGDMSVAEIADLLAVKVPLAVIKLGADGALIVSGDKRINIPALQEVEVVDTTGAGDYFAAGFFYGISRKLPLRLCGRIGTLSAAAVIGKSGTLLSGYELKCLKNIIDREVNDELSR